ncbi:MAG TPA: LuxR C-terminal-related transcriptional regulator, partial [Candidatus Dormibacteraeota bacterium]|nr:LuxR C-terminal-related transcriptional regulator [Candidatus Dormibacteraeota bacterium]
SPLAVAESQPMSADGLAAREGLAALAEGRFAEARLRLESALEGCAPGDRGQIEERLATACFALEDYESGLLHARSSFRLHRASGAVRRAAFTAILIANIHQNMGDLAAQRGWLGRAGRLLKDQGRCLEAGYFAVATSACDVLEIERLREQTRTALEIAREFGDTDLEVRALADGGLALVASGQVAEGFAWLDEAMAAIVAGEVANHVFAAKSCCAMMHACDRIGDVERASEWARAVSGYAQTRFGSPAPPILMSHCRIALGSLLAETGRWPEAEAELAAAMRTSRAVQKQMEAAGRLAELLVLQGKLSEAERLLAGCEDAPAAIPARVRLHLVRDELDRADGAVRRGLRELGQDLPAAVRLLCLQVEVEVRAGHCARGRRVASEAMNIARRLGTVGHLAAALLATGRAAAACGEDAAAPLTEALTVLGETPRPVLRAEIRLELALATRDKDRRAAVEEADAALAVFRRLGQRREADRAAALLREFGVRAKSVDPGVAGDKLTAREREVLELLSDGLTNAQIAQRLFITARTAEHHVASILAKLSLSRRSEAAAYAARARPGADPVFPPPSLQPNAIP